MASAIPDDMFTPEVISDPYAYYGRIRDEDPVHWNDTYEVWVVTRHDDLVWLTRHHELFSSAVFKNDPRPAYPAIDESDLGLYEYVRNYQGDQFIQHDRTELLTEGMKGMIDYVSPLVDERLVNPGDDFISVLASGEKAGIFTRHQVLVNTSLLLLAGHETTINLLCNGTLAFINHPDQWALLKKDPAGAAKLATEECLRYDSPVKSIQRIASEDVEMRGKVLKKDDRVRWFISSANRDPAMFANADTFDINRWPNQHVAFGSGIHHCLGATLARVEGQEVFKALAERFSGFRLDNTALEYQPSITFRSLKSLPINWQ